VEVSARSGITSHVTEAAFAVHRQRDWTELDALVRRAADKGPRALSTKEIARVSPLYRDLCADLARAQAARYSAPLVEYLQGLTASAHGVLYGGKGRARAVGARAMFGAFPRAVRAHWRAMAIAFVLFFGPLAFGVLASLDDPAFAFRIVPESQLRQLTEAYAKGFDAGRQGGEGALMAGFYVNNNVGIALRCFATGIFGGLGSAFYLVQNGLSIGAILGYVASQGAGGNILVFVVGHSSLELGAIVIAGGAGLTLGWSIVVPGEKTRLASLQDRARDVVVIVCGAAVMLVMAAGVEGFWSGSSIPAQVKFGFGAAMLLLVCAYLLLAGRGGARREGEAP
jgi:uncharacterized membrane protein SpoIIM required for sporulation